MLLKNITLYIDDLETGRLKMKFKCTTCGIEMDEPEHWQCRCHLREKTASKNEIGYSFMCDKCYGERFRNE